MAKRRKKRNNSSAKQPSVPDSVNVASEQPSSTAAETEGSPLGSSLGDQSGAAVVAANKGVNSSGFFQGTKEELEKVVWPDRQQLISESIAVFLMVSLSAVIISLIDNLFRWASQLVFG